MRIVILLVFLMQTTTTIFAQNQLSGTIDFTIRNAGFNVKGNFSDLQASIQFNPKDLENSRIMASVSAESINTNNQARDRHLRDENYFWVDKHPRIIMKSVSFKKTDSGFEGIFELEMKGTKKNITMPFTVQKNGNSTTYLGNFSINRTDFSIGARSLILSNQATISIQVIANK